VTEPDTTRNARHVRAATTATRIWGLIVLAIGLWLFADVTLGLTLPRIPLRDLWPVALIVIGVGVILQGASGRR
jgi:hypothetical protein